MILPALDINNGLMSKLQTFNSETSFIHLQRFHSLMPKSSRRAKQSQGLTQSLHPIPLQHLINYIILQSNTTVLYKIYSIKRIKQLQCFDFHEAIFRL